MDYWDDPQEDKKAKPRYEPVLKFSYIHPNKNAKQSLTKVSSYSRSSDISPEPVTSDPVSRTRKQGYSYTNTIDTDYANSGSRVSSNDRQISYSNSNNKNYNISKQQTSKENSRKVSKPIMFSECTYEERQEERRKLKLKNQRNLDDDFLYYKKIEPSRRKVTSPSPERFRSSYSPIQRPNTNQESGNYYSERYTQSSFDSNPNIERQTKSQKQQSNTTSKSSNTNKATITVTERSNTSNMNVQNGMSHLHEPSSRSESPIDFRSRRAKFEKDERQRDSSLLYYNQTISSTSPKKTESRMISKSSNAKNATVTERSGLSRSSTPSYTHEVNVYSSTDHGNSSNRIVEKKNSGNREKTIINIPKYEYGSLERHSGSKTRGLDGSYPSLNRTNVSGLNYQSTSNINQKESNHYKTESSLHSANIISTGGSMSLLTPTVSENISTKRSSSIDGRPIRGHTNSVVNMVRQYEDKDVEEDNFYLDFYHMKIARQNARKQKYGGHLNDRDYKSLSCDVNSTNYASFINEEHQGIAQNDNFRANSQKELKSVINENTKYSADNQSVSRTVVKESVSNNISNPGPYFQTAQSSVFPSNSSKTHHSSSTIHNEYNSIPNVSEQTGRVVYREAIHNSAPVNRTRTDEVHRHDNSISNTQAGYEVKAPVDNNYYVTTTVTTSRSNPSASCDRQQTTQEKRTSKKHNQVKKRVSSSQNFRNEVVRPRSQSADACEMTRKLAREESSMTASNLNLSSNKAPHFKKMTFNARQKCEAFYVNSDQRLLNIFFDRLIDQHNENSGSELQLKREIVEQSKFIRDKPISEQSQSQSVSKVASTNSFQNISSSKSSSNNVEYNHVVPVIQKSTPRSESLHHTSYSREQNVSHKTALPVSEIYNQNSTSSGSNSISYYPPTKPSAVSHQQISQTATSSRVNSSLDEYQLQRDSQSRTTANDGADVYTASYINYDPVSYEYNENYSRPDLSHYKSPIFNQQASEQKSQERQVKTRVSSGETRNYSRNVSNDRQASSSQNQKLNTNDQFYSHNSSSSTNMKGNESTLNYDNSFKRNAQSMYAEDQSNSVVNVQTLRQENHNSVHDTSKNNSSVLRFVIDSSDGMSNIEYRRQQYLKSLEADLSFPTRYGIDPPMVSPAPRRVQQTRRR